MSLLSAQSIRGWAPGGEDTGPRCDTVERLHSFAGTHMALSWWLKRCGTVGSLMVQLVHI
jgi:hypothetical protein